MSCVGRKAYFLAVILTGGLLGGCSTTPVDQASDPGSAACLARFVATDRLVARAGLRDEGEGRVPGFPYLRSNRLLASFGEELEDPARFAVWIAALGELDAAARSLELRNLAATSGVSSSVDEAQLGRCRSALIERDLRDPLRREALREAAVVADDYHLMARIAGLYPLATPFIGRGVRRWQEEARTIFATPLAQLPVRGTLQRWSAGAAAALPAQEIRALVERSRDTLGIPDPTAADAQRLLAAFAPIWEIDVVDENDRIGKVRRWPQLAVDPDEPQEYRLLTQTRHGDQVLLQLVYVIWLPARPGSDIYAGALDGLIWRVTLDVNGEPLLYDSIHNCGCYHLFFSRPGLRLRSDLPTRNFEPPLLAQSAPDQQQVIRISHGRHYIERVYQDQGERPVRGLKAVPYQQLRALPGEQGGGSLFGRYGLVPGSERGERFLLWPAGIRSAGAMRQWGRHPVAFLGRRHFDDPWLIDELFTRENHDAQR